MTKVEMLAVIKQMTSQERLETIEASRIMITTASGNSGSPVLDPLNRVVGVDASSPKSTILKREGANFTATSGSAEPINLVMQRLRDWGI